MQVKETLEEIGMMQTHGKVFRCFIHCAGGNGAGWGMEDCNGHLITRRSIYGAVTRGCIVGWDQFDLSGWPEILSVEEL